MGQGRPVLGALGEMLQYGAQAIPQQQMQQATMAQRYAEFQEEKRARQAQAGATADYRNKSLGLEQGRLDELIRHNRVSENQPVPVTPEKPLTESQVKGQHLSEWLASASPEDKRAYFLGIKPTTSGGGTDKRPASVSNKLVDSFLKTREVPATVTEDAYQPEFTPGTLDTLNSLIETGKFPPQQQAPSRWSGLFNGATPAQNQKPLTDAEEQELNYLLSKYQGR